MIRRSRTLIAKALRMSAPEIVRMAGIVEIAGAGEAVRAAVVVVVVGAVVAAAAAGVVTAAGMVATAAAEGIKPRIAIYESQNPQPFDFAQGRPVAQNTTRVGHPEMESCDLVAALFFWEEFAQVRRKCSGHPPWRQNAAFSGYCVPCSGRGKFAHSGCECS